MVECGCVCLGRAEDPRGREKQQYEERDATDRDHDELLKHVQRSRVGARSDFRSAPNSDSYKEDDSAGAGRSCHTVIHDL